MNYVVALCILCMCTGVSGVQAQQFAQVQFVQNAADPMEQQVDVYLNGTRLYDDFAFRSFMPYETIQAGVPMSVVIATSGSLSAIDGVITTATIGPFSADGRYMVMTGGVRNTAGFRSNPDGRDIGYTMFSVGEMRNAAQDPTKVDLRLIQGSTDLGAMDVHLRGRSRLADDMLYGDNSAYSAVEPGMYTIDITSPIDSTAVLASFRADLSMYAGDAMTLFVSGFDDPMQNSNGMPVGLFGITGSGERVEFPRMASGGTAMIQFVHTSADPSVPALDVYINGTKTLNDLGFRTASTMTQVAAGVPLTITLATGNSMSVTDGVLRTITVASLTADTRTLVFLGGVHTPDGFALNPDNSDISLQPYVITNIRDSSEDSSKVEMFVFHGATDVPAIDVVQRGGDMMPGDSVGYGQWSSYMAFTPDIYRFDVREAGDTTAVLGSYRANLFDLKGRPLALFTSGFSDPSMNRNGAGFGLFALYPDGTVRTLPSVSSGVEAYIQIVHTSADPSLDMVDLYLNGERISDDLGFNSATSFLPVPADIPLDIVLSTSNSMSVDGDTLHSVTVGPLMEDQRYILLVSGLSTTNGFSTNPNGRDLSLNLMSVDSIRTEADNPSMVDLYFFHGVGDAPQIDIVERGGATRVDRLSYGDQQGYRSVQPGEYVFDITPAGNNTNRLASFEADLTGMAGQSVFLYASGFLTPENNMNGEPLGLYMVSSDGTVTQLPQYTGETQPAMVQIIHNVADPTAAAVDVYVNGTKVADNAAFRSATSFVEVASGEQIGITVAGSGSMGVDDAVVTTATVGPFMANQRYVLIIGGVGTGGGFADNPTGLDTRMQVYTIADIRDQAQDPSRVDVRLFHGTTDAPALHVDLRGGNRLAGDLSYGSAADYFTVEPGLSVFDVFRASDAQPVSSFTADFTGMGGMPVTVFASGFLDPSMNNNGQPFGLFAALPNGTVLPLMQTTTDVDDVPAVVALSAAYPNPAADQTTVAYRLTAPQTVLVTLVDASGRIVMTVDAGIQDAGSHTLALPTAGLADGVYAYSVRVGNTTTGGTLVVLR